MFFLLLGQAFGSDRAWSSYAVGVAATAISMPITYKSAQALAGSSNKLVPGLVPSLLIGITAPATAAWAGTHWMGKSQSNIALSPWKSWGSMVGLNTILWASGSAVGMSSDRIGNALAYGLVTSLVLPLPALKLSHSLTIAPVQTQTADATFAVQGNYCGTF